MIVHNPAPLRHGGPRTLARSVTIDMEEHELFIDGVRLPWWLEASPEVDANRDGVSILRIGIFVEGQCMIRTGDIFEIVDPILGHVGDYARRLVQEEFAKAFTFDGEPWRPTP